MKEKILAALKTKYNNLGFTDKAFDGVAEYLSKTVTEEAAIEGAITGVDGLLKAFQGDADKRVTEAVEKVKKETKPAEPKKTEEPKKPEEAKKPSEEVPEWAKSLIESNKTLSEKLNTIDADKAKVTRRQTLEGKLVNVPEQFKAKVLKDFDRMSFEKDEDFNTYLTDTNTDIAALNQELADKGLGQQGPPNLGQVNKDGVSKAVETYVADTTKASTQFEGKKV